MSNENLLNKIIELKNKIDTQNNLKWDNIRKIKELENILPYDIPTDCYLIIPSNLYDEILKKTSDIPDEIRKSHMLTDKILFVKKELLDGNPLNQQFIIG